MHAYQNILKQIASTMKLDVSAGKIEKEIIKTAFGCARENKTIYTIIDEAHLLDMNTLRKLRLLFDQFPKNHNLILIGQRDLMYYLSMKVNEDIKTRITYSKNFLPLNDADLDKFIQRELSSVGLGANIFDDSAIDLIIRSVSGNLRLCCNLCYGSLFDACRANEKIVTVTNVNAILIQPHWRSHEDLIKQDVF
jgi:type II secretory pathway predicted ATPase ExeA